MKSRKRSTAAALTSSALAIPGMAAAETPRGYTAEYGFSFYAEEDLPASKVQIGNETERYEIETHQFHFSAPLFDRMDLGLDVLYESMSGATPWFVEPDADGDPVQVMSGATVDEERTDALLSGSYYFDDSRLGLQTGASFENDYTAINGALDGEWSFHEGNTTLASGAGFSYDLIDPTDAEEFGRPESEDKQTYSVFLGLSQVLGRGAVVQANLSYRHSRGFLSDPYKLVQIAGVNEQDRRPDSRNGGALLARYRQHFESIAATLHADYRYYLDDWEIHSHTLELAWYQSLWNAFRVIPSFRYYSQSQADFYAPFFTSLAVTEPASSDYRLSPYGAISWGIRAEALLRGWPWEMDWRLGFQWERYLSDADFALGKVDVEAPGLVDFDVYSVTLTTRF